METKEIITPIEKHKVVLKSFITVKEERLIKRIMKDVEVTVENSMGGEPTQKIKPFNLADKTEETENKTFEIIVISVDGETENVLEKLENMDKRDGNFLKREVNKITEGDDFLEKSQTPNSGGNKDK